MDQLITHLTYADTTAFFMASSLYYIYDGSTISGLRFVKYSYNYVSAALTTTANKVLINLDSFPSTFGSQSPKLTAFRYYKKKLEACGAIKRNDPASEDLWLFTWDNTRQTSVDYTKSGTMRTILDCNAYNYFISYYLVQEVTAG